MTHYCEAFKLEIMMAIIHNTIKICKTVIIELQSVVIKHKFEILKAPLFGTSIRVWCHFQQLSKNVIILSYEDMKL